MSKFKEFLKRICTGAIAAIVALTSTDLSSLQVAAADDHYTGSYTIESILSQYEYFVSGDATLSCHTVGSIAVGGKYAIDIRYENSFGQGAQYPSYIGTSEKVIYAFNDFYGVSSPDSAKKIYYMDIPDTAFYSWGDNAERIKVSTPYFDFSKMSDINSQAKDISEAAYVVTASDISGTTLNINLFTHPNIAIPYELYKDIEHININGISSAFDFHNNVYSISVTGAGSNTVTVDGSSQIKVNNVLMNIYLEALGKSVNDMQIYLEGMNLVWLFPDATGNVVANNMGGHIVAPLANVSVVGGNIEGSVIAASLYGDSSAEGHYYPFYPLKSLPKNTYAKIQGTKTDDSTPAVKLQNAVFGLYDTESCDNTPLATATTDANGIFLFDNISTGSGYKTYWVKEISAPSGYKLNTTSYKVEVPKGSTDTKNVNNNNAIIDEKIVKKVTVYGYKEEYGKTSKWVKGAGFTLYNSTKDSIVSNEVFTDENGRFEFKDIVVADEDTTYYVKETTVPAPFKQNDYWYGVIVESNAKDGDTIRVYGNNSIPNIRKKVKIEGTKVEAVHSSTGVMTVPLENAGFTLYKENKNDIAHVEVFSDKNGYFAFENIEVGDEEQIYFVKETTIPEGHEEPSKEWYEVKVSPSVEDNHIYIVNDPYPIKNVKNTVNITGTKKGKENGETDDKAKELEGAGFTLYAANKETVIKNEVFTDDKGEFTFYGVDVGATYYVKETTIPSEYQRVGGEWYKIEVPATAINGETIQLIDGGKAIINEKKPPKYVKIQGIKKGKENGAADTTATELKGATFTLYDASKTQALDTATSDDDGIFTFTGIEVGATDTIYYVKETGVPSGYNGDDNYYLVRVPATATNGRIIPVIDDGKNEIINEKNEPDKKYVKIIGTKKGKANGADDNSATELSGAGFTLYKSDKSTVVGTEQKSGSNGKFTFTGIEVGSSDTTYYVKETTVPTGYKDPGEKWYEVVVPATATNGQECFVNDNKAIINEKIASDKKYVKIQGYKKGKEYGASNSTAKELEGAGFTLYRGSTTNKVREEVKTNSKGIFEFTDIEVEDVDVMYYVKETSAPEGYEPDPIYYEVKVFKTSTNNYTYKVLDGDPIYNVKKPKVEKYVNIKGLKSGKANKAANNTAKPLENVGFTLYEEDKATKIGSEVKTNEKGEFTFAKIKVESTEKIYYVKETTVPEGYKGSDEWYEAKVLPAASDGADIWVNNKNAIINEKLPPTGDGEFSKSDGKGKELEGAHISLTCTDKSVDLSSVSMKTGSGGTDYVATATLISWTSTKDIVRLTGLPNGTYIMSEDLSPLGYDLTDDISFKMKEGHMYDMHDVPIDSVNMVDSALTDPYKGILKGRKTDGVNGIGGAIIGLYSDAGCNTLVAKATSAFDGTFRFEGLETGKYYVKEIGAPSGYAISTKIYGYYDVEVGRTIKMDEDIVNRKLCSLSGKKVDGNGKGLAGAQIGLYSDAACTSLVLKDTSRSDGSFRFVNLKPGTYYVKEISAPAGYKQNDAVFGPYTLNSGDATVMERDIVNEDNPTGGGGDGGDDGGKKTTTTTTTTTPKTSKTTKSKNTQTLKSPKTGENHWPIIVFEGSGVMVIIGTVVVSVRKKKKEVR